MWRIIWLMLGFQINLKKTKLWALPQSSFPNKYLLILEGGGWKECKLQDLINFLWRVGLTQRIGDMPLPLWSGATWCWRRDFLHMITDYSNNTTMCSSSTTTIWLVPPPQASTCQFREQIMAPWPQRCQGKLCSDTSTTHLLRRCMTGSSAEHPPPKNIAGHKAPTWLFLKNSGSYLLMIPPVALWLHACVCMCVCVSEVVCSEAVKRKNKRRKMMLLLKGSFMQHTLYISWQL